MTGRCLGLAGKVALPAFIAIVAASALYAGGPVLPPDGFLGVWKRAAADKVYIGAQLYDYIDGGAEIFFELGFDRVTVQRYTAGADEIDVELYTMADPTAALGIYLAKCGQETPAAGFAQRHTAGRHQLMLVRERYFLIVDNLSGNAERAAALVEFARAVAEHLPAAANVEALAALPTDGMLPGSQRIIRGPLGVQAFILLGEGDIFELGGTLTAVAGRYRSAEGSGGERTLIIVPYSDAARARAVLERVKAHLDPEIKLVAASAERLVFLDYTKRYGVLAVIGGRLELTLGLAQPPRP